jgi:hypothetical protein
MKGVIGGGIGFFAGIAIGLLVHHLVVCAILGSVAGVVIHRLAVRER